MARSNEPFVWSLFASGGMVAAMFMPAHLLIVCILVPLGLSQPLSHEAIHGLFSHPITRIYLIVLISLPLFHFAHRLRFTLGDLGLRGMSTLLATVLYGVAVVGTLFAVIALISL